MKNTITLYTEKGRRGADIERNKYEQIYQFIITLVSDRKTVTVTELLDLSFSEFPGEDRNSQARAILMVKQDLVMRKILKVQFDPERIQHITLVKKLDFSSLAEYRMKGLTM